MKHVPKPNHYSHIPADMVADIDAFLDKMNRSDEAFQTIELLAESYPVNYFSYILSGILSLALNAIKNNETNNEFSRINLLDFAWYSKFNKPAIFLNDHGNFRLFWCNDGGEQVGLQFLGDNIVQYVIFSKKNNAELNTCHGRTHVDNIKDLVTANGLKDMVYIRK